MFERLLRPKVIVPVLAAVVVSTVAAHVGFGLPGLVAAMALWQIAALAVLAKLVNMGREHRRRLVANREQLERAHRRLADLESTAQARHDEVLRQLAEIAKGIRADRKHRGEEHRETQAWRKGVGAQLKTLKERQVTREQVHDLLVEQADRTSTAIAAGGRKQYAQLDALSGLYYGLRPPKQFPVLAGWAASPDLLRYLYNLVRDEHRTAVIECGSGVTTLVMAYAMRELGTGKVVALEHLERFADRTRELLNDHGVSDWAEVHHAPLTEVKLDDETWTWYDLGRVPAGPFDLLVVDGPPATVGESARFPAVPVLHDRLSHDAVVVLDDHDRPEERAIGKRWGKELPDWKPRHLKHDKGTLELRSPAAEARR